MSFSNNLISAIDSIIYAFKRGRKSSLKDYCELESVLSENIIVAKDGSMATIFELYGSTKFIGTEEISELEESLYSALKTSLQKEGHLIQFVFAKDKDRVRDHIDGLLEPYIKAANNKDLDLSDLFTSKGEFLEGFCVFESCHVVVWSRPEIIKETLNQQKKENAERAAKAPLAANAQNIIIEYDRLESNHEAFCQIIEESFLAANLNMKKLNVRAAIKVVRNSIDYETTGKKWEASLPILLDKESNILDERIMPPMKEEQQLRLRETDVSSIMWPSISEQVFSNDIEAVDSNIVKIGNKFVSSMYVDIPPQIVRPFRALLDSIDDDIPLQISFILESGGLNKEKLKTLFASILAVTNSGNKMVRDSISSLRELSQNGDAIIKMSINITTWAKELAVLNVRKQLVIQKVQNWGNSQVVFNNIDPIEGVLSAIPAITYKSTGTAALAPLVDIIQMLPLSRQSHVWDYGSILFRTYDGKIFPFQPGSSLQSTWNYLIFALPGSGKSVLMNCLNLAAVTQPGSSELPMIGIIEIGESSSGFIRLVQDSLPEGKKHLALYEKLQNSEDYAINVLDTNLGCRFPTASDKAFLKNFLTLVMTPAGKDPYESTDAMISKVVEVAYKYYSDDADAQPKQYQKGRNETIDKVLLKLGIDPIGMSWWSIVDELFKKGQKRYASIAQRYAVPILDDLVAIATKTPSIRDVYSKPVAQTQENMINLFQRSITESVQQYPMLNMPTVFDVSNARIISLDLDEVAKGEDIASIKQTSIMYMLARNIVGKKFKLSPQEIENIVPDLYKSTLMAEAKKTRETKKILCLDEFHKTKGQAAIRNQVVTDQREGRKWNLQVILASQQIEDFSAEMRRLSTGTFILSGGSDNYKDLTEKFNLNKTTSEIVRTKLNGASKKGVPFVFNCKTINGEYSQYLYSTISPIELWSTTTTSEDVALFSKLKERVGSARARIILADKFGGSAKSTIERIQLDTDNIEASSDPYTYIVKKLLKQYNEL